MLGGGADGICDLVPGRALKLGYFFSNIFEV
jgi:hypothetical protein